MNHLLTKLDALRDRYKNAVANKNEAAMKMKEAESLHYSATEAHEIIQAVGKEVQFYTFRQIERIVSECLKTVFGENTYDVKLVYTERAGKSNYHFEFINGDDPIDAMDGTGGGIVDVAAFALRVAAMMMTKPTSRQILILDEPFRFVSREFRENVSQLLYKMAEQFDLQIIVITHMDDLEIGNVHRIG